MNDQKMRKLVHPSVTKELVREYGFQFKKSLGQNFLINSHILDKIVEAAELDSDAGALEIGPGMGTLTQALAEEAGVVVAIEKDARLLPVLARTLDPYENVKIEHADVLEIDLHQLMDHHFGSRPVSVVANLPYYITTPIIMKLLEDRLPLRCIVVMVQKEVAERMAAKPGGKEYGVLSVAVQYYTEPEVICSVPTSSFIPEPGVESAVIRLTVRSEPPADVPDPDLFFQVVKSAFAQRRKTLLNNLQGNYQSIRPEYRTKEFWGSFLTEIGIEPSRRAETLSIGEFAAISRGLIEKTKNS